MRMDRKLGNILVAIGAALTLGVFGCSNDNNNSPGTDGSVAKDTGTGSDAASASLPPQVTCSGSVCKLSGEITQSFTMTMDKEWLLQGGVFIGDDVNKTVLTIEAGTKIFGETSSKAFLTVRRGSQIIAEGTKAAPIVFSSSKPEGSRARGDWGGVVLNGRAPINGCTNPGANGCEAEGEGGTGKYGGNDPEDNSGVLRYVRVEFAGHPITPDNELNGIAFQGVGRKTVIEYIQIHMAADDGMEFFGGTAQFKYVLTTGCADDNLDWTDGWQGKGQFFVAQQYDDNGDNGIEADNSGEDNKALPRSKPTLANLTLIGVPTSEKSDIGMLLREGTAAKIYSAIVTSWNESCLDIDHEETFTNAGSATALSGELTIEGSIISCTTPFKEDAADPFKVSDFFTTLNVGNRLVDPALIKPLDTAEPNFAPQAGSPALTGGKTPENDDFFTKVNFVGGVDPQNDWTKGWTTTARN